MNRREQIAYWGGAALIALFASAIFVNTTFLQPQETEIAGRGLIISTQRLAQRSDEALPRTLPLARTHVRVRVTETRDEKRAPGRARGPWVKRTASLGKPATTTAHSPLIAQVQRKLAQMGYNPGPIDGRMGPATRAAIVKFQLAHNMPPTGEIEPGVLALLLP